MSSYSPSCSHGDVNAMASTSFEAHSPSPSKSFIAHNQSDSHSLFSKLRKQAPRLFAKSKSARPSSGHSYLRSGGRGGVPGIQSEPPSFTGYSTDQEQDLSLSTSPKTSRPESSAGVYQNSAAAVWQRVPGQPGIWSFGNNNNPNAQQLHLKEASMLILTEVEKASLREIALQTLRIDPDLRTKMTPYIERLNPLNNQTDANSLRKQRHGGVSKFFSRLSHLRFSTGSYSSASPPLRGALPRSKGKKGVVSSATDGNGHHTAHHIPSLVFGTTLKRCIANEILAERKRLVRLERQTRCSRLPALIAPGRKLEPLSPINQEDRLHPDQAQPKREHLPLNRRSSVNTFSSQKLPKQNKNLENAQSNLAENQNISELVTDDADSGFHDEVAEVAPLSVKATSFDTGRRFERLSGDSPGPMPLQVPQFVKKCVRHIETYGLDTEGIFRLGTSKKRIKSQITEIQRSADFIFTADHSVHDTAALLKEFFRDLPEPLLTRSLYAAFIAVGSLSDSKRALSLLRLLVLLLPSVHRDTLYYLLVFLRSVAAHAAGVEGSTTGGNKMTSHNLATLFGPNILRMSGFSGNSGAQDSHVKVDSAEMEAFAAAVKSSDHSTMKRQSSEHFEVESKDRADERLAVIEVVQLMIDNHETIFQIPIDLMDQMFIKMFHGDFGSTRHNSTAVKTHAFLPPYETIERLLFKRAGCRSTGGVAAAPNPSYYNDSALLSCTSLSVQSSPSTTEKAPRHQPDDEGNQKLEPEPQISATLHPNVNSSVSRSEGDLTSGSPRRFEDDPRYYRLTGRPRPCRYGQSYASKIHIDPELLQAASTWDELRTAIAHTPNKQQGSNTMPRITVTVTPSSAPDTPIPSQVRA